MTDIEITNGMTIWFPGIYHGREGEYEVLASDIPRERLVELVQKRAKEDGEWAIANGFVGEDNKNEPLMRKMMAWVSDEKNIIQAYEYEVTQVGNQPTVDWICRDLANASKWVGGDRD